MRDRLAGVSRPAIACVTFAVAVLWAPGAHAEPPDFHEVPAALRTAPDRSPLTPTQRDALSARKILAQLVNDHGPEPWPGAAVAIIDGSPAEVFSVLRDYAHFSSFMPYVASATVDEHASNRWRVSYVVKGPLGIGDRQYQLDTFDEHERLDGVDVTISRFVYTGRGNIKSSVGTWKLVPLWDAHTTFVRYESRTDPGGSFTQWLKRKVAAGGLTRVIEAVRKRVTERRAETR